MSLGDSYRPSELVALAIPRPGETIPEQGKSRKDADHKAFYEAVAALDAGDSEQLSRFLKKHAELASARVFFWEWDWGSTALHKAVDTEDVELIRYLLEKGADTTIGDVRWGETAYDWAGYYDNDAMREVLKLHARE